MLFSGRWECFLDSCCLASCCLASKFLCQDARPQRLMLFISFTKMAPGSWSQTGVQLHMRRAAEAAPESRLRAGACAQLPKMAVSLRVVTEALRELTVPAGEGTSGRGGEGSGGGRRGARGPEQITALDGRVTMREGEGNGRPCAAPG